MKKFDLLSSVFVAKHILDMHKELVSSIQHDRQYLGDKKFDTNEKVKLHTCIKPLIGVIKRIQCSVYWYKLSRIEKSFGRFKKECTLVLQSSKQDKNQ